MTSSADWAISTSMELLISLQILLNQSMNTVVGPLFSPVAVLPGGLSITVISAVLGVFLLLIFKYTSNQTAIGKVRDSVNANLIAAWLFKDSLAVTLKSQLNVLGFSCKLLYYSIIPLLVMIVPVILVMAQMGLWYQARPIALSDDPVMVKVTLAKNIKRFPEVRLEPSAVFQKTKGPVRIVTQKEVLWELKALKPGQHELVFAIDGKKYTKQFAAGDGFTKVSLMRPGRDLAKLMLHPLEKPFSKDSPVASITIDYPDRDSKVCGTDWWIFYFFICSMVFAFAFKPFMNVRI